MQAFMARLQAIFNGQEGPDASALLHLAHWDQAYGPDYREVLCSDLFWWGTADGEEISPATLPILEQAVADLQAANPDGTYTEADLLYCCRVRHMRPQQPYYRHIAPHLHALFDACGPDRQA